MNFLKIGVILFVCVSMKTLNAQNWKPCNDTLVYFYQASNTGDYFTARTKQKIIALEDTTIIFVNNYIPCDSIAPPGLGYPEYYFYSNNGSVFGKEIRIKGDTLWLDENLRFVNNMLLGESLPYTADLTITYSDISDTILFEIADSVKYYLISDGSRLMQSKNYGIISFPKPFTDSIISYNLVGIEGICGKDFNIHNKIFDFEIGDEFYYRLHQNNWMDVIGPGTTDYGAMRVLHKFLIGDMYYYTVESYGGLWYYSIYPPLHPGNTIYDHPGEQVKFCRASDLFYGYPDDWSLGSSILWDDWSYRGNMGFRIDTTDEGNLVQLIGISELDYITYQTFGSNVMDEGVCELTYYESDDGIYSNLYFPSGGVAAAYEEGFGLTHHIYTRVETIVSKDLIGAVVSGDTLGHYFDLGLSEEELSEFSVYPNPSNSVINFEFELCQLAIFNSVGELVARYEGSLNQLEIAELSPGIYILEGLDHLGNKYITNFIRSSDN